VESNPFIQWLTLNGVESVQIASFLTDICWGVRCTVVSTGAQASVLMNASQAREIGEAFLRIADDADRAAKRKFAPRFDHVGE
jgi:hypothetical protein